MDDYIKREESIIAAMDYNGCGNAQDASQDIAAALDRAKTDEIRDLAFRCSECPFSDSSFCKIKQFVHDRSGAETAYSISAMSR